MPPQPHRLRPMGRFATAVLAAAALSTPVLANGPTPDPPIPPEVAREPIVLASAGPVALRNAAIALPSSARALDVPEPDCRCSALYMRDLGRRIEGHVERWESLPRLRAPAAAAPLAGAMPAYVQVAAFVEGMVGFPLHDYRLSD